MAALLDNESDLPESHDLQVAYDLIYDAKRLYERDAAADAATKAKEVLTWCSQTEEAKHHVHERKTDTPASYNSMWCLGISSTEHPNKIMASVFRALREHDFVYLPPPLPPPPHICS